MFGYVKPYTPELRMIENQYYRAAYCGLCRSMRDETGMLSRMTLSYDITFLVLIRLALTGEIPEFEKKRCFVHPLKKRLVMRSCEASRYSAHAGTLLTRHKFSDDINDEKGLKRIGAFLMRSIFSGAYKKAKSGYSDLDEKIKLHLYELNKLERERIRSADRPAAVFGTLMADIASHGIEDEEKKLIASSLGMAIGRWIYLIDALDDIEDDRKRKSYNPFLLLFDGSELDNEKKMDIEAAMLGVPSKAGAALDLLSFDGRRDLEGLLRNMITEGLPRMTRSVIYENGKLNNETIFENGDNQ